MSVLVLLAIYSLRRWSSFAQQTAALDSAHQLQIAIGRMATDAEATPDPKLGWPGDLPDIKTAGDLVERLVEYKYIDRGDLKVYFHAPGVERYTGNGVFQSGNSGFKFYKVTKQDTDQAISIATKNFTFGDPLDPKAIPFGSDGAVIIHKGGDGRLVTPGEAKTSANGAVGLMPGATNPAAPGTERDVLE